MSKIQLSVGDRYNDGHGRYEKYIAEINQPHSTLSMAYQVASELLGFNFSDVVCSGYEEHQIKNKHLEKLMEHRQHDTNNVLQNFEDERYVEREMFARLYLFICQIGYAQSGNTLEWKIVQPERMPEFDIGGYGLFS